MPGKNEKNEPNSVHTAPMSAPVATVRACAREEGSGGGGGAAAFPKTPAASGPGNTHGARALSVIAPGFGAVAVVALGPSAVGGGSGGGGLGAKCFGAPPSQAANDAAAQRRSAFGQTAPPSPGHFVPRPGTRAGIPDQHSQGARGSRRSTFHSTRCAGTPVQGVGAVVNGRLIVADGTTAIPAQACYSRRDINEVVLPASIVSVGHGAFKGCSGIVNLRLPGTLRFIGNRVFQGCAGIVDLHLPDTLESIGSGAFSECSGIVDLRLPATLQHIGDGAFEQCSSIVALRLPDALRSIGNGAFRECSGIVDLRLPATLRSIGGGAFSGCSGVVGLRLPDALQSIGGGVFQGDGAFSECSGIVDLRLPDALQSIGGNTFHACTGIVALRLPATLRSIGHGAFQGCTGLATLVLPAGCAPVGNGPRAYARDGSGRSSLVGKGAFHGCASLAHVLAPDALARGEAADPAEVFEGCPVLAGAGLTPHSAVRPLRRTLWHPTMHAWCTGGQHACILAVLVAELRSDRQAEAGGSLPSLAHDLWLLILQFVPRHALGRPWP